MSSSPAEIGTSDMGLWWCICQCQDCLLCGGSGLTRFTSGAFFIYPCCVRRIPMPASTTPVPWFLSILLLTWRGWVWALVQCLPFCLCKQPLGSSLCRKVTGKTNVWVALETPRLYDHGFLRGTVGVRLKYHLCSLWTGKPGCLPFLPCQEEHIWKTPGTWYSKLHTHRKLLIKRKLFSSSLLWLPWALSWSLGKEFSFKLLKSHSWKQFSRKKKKAWQLGWGSDFPWLYFKRYSDKPLPTLEPQFLNLWSGLMEWESLQESGLDIQLLSSDRGRDKGGGH